MASIVGKIVLTGGPCAGKTTALAKIEEYYQEKGYKVLVVSESATELINGGIRPFGNQGINLFGFQSLIARYQYFKEQLYLDAVKEYGDDDKVIIVYDRGFLDNKAYIGQRKFNELLKELNLSEIDVMDNYDMVIHLVTAADGAESAYTLSNNGARTETAAEAKALDKKTIDAWAGHQNLKIIKNDTSFEEKMDKVIESINSLINAPLTTRKQYKYLINLNKSDLSFLNEDNSTMIYLKQYYLDDANLETRLRERTYNGAKTYYITVQQPVTTSESKVITDRRITEGVFRDFLEGSSGYKEISKKRYSFVINKQYYRLDVFEDSSYAILEVETTLDNKEVSIPSYFDVVEEVTNNAEYKNSSLAKQEMKLKSLGSIQSEN